MFNIKFTPEAFFMIPLAIGLDLTGIILFCFFLDDFGMTDAIGIVMINGWLILRGKKLPKDTRDQGRKGLLKNLGTLFTKEPAKFFVPSLGELIPYFGVLPFWTLTVLLNLSED